MSQASDKSGVPTEHGRGARLFHRSRNHESAHLEAPGGGDGHAFAQPMAHPLVCPGQPELITTDAGLVGLLADLRAAGSFAYDSEFIGERSYIPQLCLVQVAVANRIALIDPLAKVNLLPFWELVCDAAVEKIVHAGEQDVEPVFRIVGKAPANVFDVQIASGFIGLPYPLSLSKLVGEMVGARLGKGLTFTNWDQRPLSSQQLRYAADDVRYLPAARAELQRRLDCAGHLGWAKEESALRCLESAVKFDPEEAFLRIRGASGLEPRHQAVLKALTIWRDEAARQEDVPPRTMLKDEIMLALAKSPVKSVDKFARIRGLPRPVEEGHGKRIIALTLEALALPETKLPKHHYYEPSPREKFLADRHWADAQCWCYGQGIDPALVTGRQEVGEVRRRVLGREPIEDMRILIGWRKAALGDRLMELIGEERGKG